MSWYELNYVNHHFLEILDYDLIQIIKGYTYQNVNELFDNYVDKMIY